MCNPPVVLLIITTVTERWGLCRSPWCSWIIRNLECFALCGASFPSDWRACCAVSCLNLLVDSMLIETCSPQSLTLLPRAGRPGRQTHTHRHSQRYFQFHGERCGFSLSFRLQQIDIWIQAEDQIARPQCSFVTAARHRSCLQAKVFASSRFFNGRICCFCFVMKK